MAFEKGHALLIGVGTYKHAPTLDVSMTATDARQVAAVLCDTRFCGYPEQQVTLLCDSAATRPTILQELDTLVKRTAKDDTVVLFYSGHGNYGEDGTYYLTTHDMRLTERRKVAVGTAASQAELLAKLQQIRAERVLLIFSACHSGMISPTLDMGETPFSGANLPSQTVAALLSTGLGRAIITSCRESQCAFVGNRAQTIFAKALVDGLSGRGVTSQRGFISVFDLYTHLYFAVVDAVQQVPPAIRQRYGETQEPEPAPYALEKLGSRQIASVKSSIAPCGSP